MTWSLVFQIVVLLLVVQILIYIFVDMVLEKRIEKLRVEAGIREADIYLAEVEATLWKAKNPGNELITWPQRKF